MKKVYLTKLIPIQIWKWYKYHTNTYFKTDTDVNTDTDINTDIATAEVATGVIDVGEINFFFSRKLTSPVKLLLDQHKTVFWLQNRLLQIISC